MGKLAIKIICNETVHTFLNRANDNGEYPVRLVKEADLPCKEPILRHIRLPFEELY